MLQQTLQNLSDFSIPIDDKDTKLKQISQGNWYGCFFKQIK